MPERNLTGEEAKFWEPKTLDRDGAACWTLGPLKLWARRSSGEWWVYTEREGASDLAMGFTTGRAPREDAGWKRWAFSEDAPVVTMVPATPDRSVVVRPERALRIPPENEVLFFVSVPIWIQVHVGEGTPALLVEEASRVLSNTWFGEPTEGELCYALKTGASRSLEGVKRGSYRFVCPLLVKNHSTQELNFQKLCLPVPYLRLYHGAQRMWSNRVSLSYLGGTQFSAVHFDSEPPGYEELVGGALKPRMEERKSFFRRSFDTIRMFGFGA